VKSAASSTILDGSGLFRERFCIYGATASAHLKTSFSIDPGRDTIEAMSTSAPFHWIVNVEAAVVHAGRYLMVIRSEQEAHAGGTLSFPGGKVEFDGPLDGVLEATAGREVAEETGVTVGDCVYVESKSFLTSDGEPVVDIVLLCQYSGGEATPGDPAEVATLLWLTADEVLAHPKTPPWTAHSIRRAEHVRLAQGW
jgi:8-oxo-dGTP diphosphatase